MSESVWTLIIACLIGFVAGSISEYRIQARRRKEKGSQS